MYVWAWDVCDVSRTDSYSRANGLQLDRPPTLGSVSVKTIVVLPSHSAAGIIQFATSSNITGSFATWALYVITYILSPHPRTWLSTYGDRAFPVATVRIWNSLPQHITSAPSLPAFCSRLKTYLFELCYTRNYCCRARELTPSFMDTLITLTCLLTYTVSVC